MAKVLKIDQMREWTADERAAKEKEWTQSLFTLRLQKATGQLENPMKIREVRKDVARLKTAARQAELGTSPKRAAKPAKGKRGTSKRGTERGAPSASPRSPRKRK